MLGYKLVSFKYTAKIVIFFGKFDFFPYICSNKCEKGMNELAKHIEILLLDNDCVIVPCFGGFVAHYVQACTEEDGTRFLPPARQIGFNPQLTLNDGLLAQSYMTVYGTSFPDATRRIESDVKRLTQALYNEGQADLPNVGQLRYSVYGTYDFQPYDNKLTTPSLYGLDQFELRPLVALPLAQPVRPGVHVTLKPIQTSAVHATASMAPAEPLPSQPATRQIVFNSVWMRQGAATLAAAAVLLLLFLLPAGSVQNTSIMRGNYAQLLPTEILSTLEQQSLAFHTVDAASLSGTSKRDHNNKKKQVKPRVVKEVKVPKLKPVATAQPAVVSSASQPVTESSASQPAVVSSASQPAKTVKPAASACRYHVIVASVGTERDARAMAVRLQNQGHATAQALIGDGKMRVAIASFDTEAQAYQHANRLRQQEAYRQAWVLKK